MSPPRRGAAGILSLTGSLALSLGSFAAAAPVEIVVQEHLISVRATDTSMRDVLDAVGKNCDIEIRSNAAMEQRVTVDTGLRRVPELLHSLLRDHSYILQYSGSGADGGSLWILAPAAESDKQPGWSTGGSDPSLDAVVLDLSDPDPEVREEAVLTLGDIGGAQVLPFLTQSLADRSGDVREAARALLDDLDVAGASALHSAKPEID